MLDTNKTVKRAKNEQVTLGFKELENPQLIIFSDASLGNCHDGGTQGGYYICLWDRKHNMVPIAWASKKLKRVARSTLTAETLAMTDAMDTGVYVANLYTELMSQGQEFRLSIVLITDGQSLFEAIKSNKSVQEKRLRVEISAIKEAIRDGQVEEVKWVNAEKQLADCLTKRGASPLRLLRALEEGVLEL